MAKKMPKFTKAPDALVALFEDVAPKNVIAERRQMFGYPSCFADGHLFAGLFQNRMFLRLAPDDLQELLREGAQPFAPMPGRVMKEYAEVPAALLANRATLAAWVERAFVFARSLPAKPEKAAKKKATKKAAKKR